MLRVPHLHPHMTHAHSLCTCACLFLVNDRINAFSINYGSVFQDRDYCSWSSHLQSSVVSTSEKSCWFNSSHARSTLNIHDDFAVAFLKNSNTVGHVPWRKISGVSACSHFLQTTLQMSGSEMTCIISGGSVCLHLQIHLDRLFAKLKAKATKLKGSLLAYSMIQCVKHVLVAIF